MGADYNFSFTTDSAPAVTSTTPADAATNVDPTANITVTFNEPVTVDTSSFDILCGQFTHFAFSVSGSGTSSITLDPTPQDLPGAASCTVTAIAAKISDVDTGDPPDHPASDTMFSFTTQDTAPTVSSTSPADGATDVARDTTIDIAFSESVTATNNAFTIACPTGTPESFSQTSSPATTFTLTPSATLPAGTVCTVKVVANQISDTDTVDPPDNMAADYTFSFTTKANSAPTDISLSNSSVDENQPSGTTVGTFTTTDPDPGDTASYGFATGTGDADNGSFQIVGDTLETNASFDFETKSSYSIRVRSTDGGGLFFEKQFTVSVNDVNEAPTDISLDKNSIDENQPSGTTIGSLTATDPDTGQTHSFTLQNSGCSGSFPNNNSFSITGNSLKSAVSFNFEVKNTYTICVRTTDSGSPPLSFDKTFTIHINDVNDAPVSTPDSYSGAIGNTVAVVQTTATGPHVTLTGNSLIANDTDEDQTFPHTLSAVAETVTSTGGGTVQINSDGSFVYSPGVGDKNQDDTFTYHVTDGSLTTAGTATIHIDDFLVWYVDNSSAAATHDGRSNSPFLGLSSLNGAGGSGDSDGPGDYIFLYYGTGGSYGGGIPLEANQNLYGEKNGLTVNGHNLVAAGSNAPTITNASGTGVGLASGVDIEGLNISGTSGDGINGSAITSATVGTTTAVNISSAGGDGVDLSGSATGNISFASPISGSAGHSVAVSGRTGGTVAFSGSINESGTGISLSSNTGGTINLTGGVTASTGASNAFVATGGGTVSVTGSANTINTTTGTALDVENTTIGASGLNFQSISANGGGHGIVLVSTGSSGGLTVTGTGSAGSGGTIQNIAGADLATNNCGAAGSAAGVGVYLNNTTSPSFSWMNFTGTFGNFGILGYSVNGFTLTHSSLTGTFGDNVNVDDDTVHFCTLTGSASISNSTISNGAETNLRVVNASGTLNRLTLQSDTFGLNQNGGGGGTLIEADGGTTNATVLDTTFQGSRGTPFDALSQTGATMDLVFGQPGHGNTIHNTHPNIVPFAQDLAVTPSGTETFDINSNHFDSASAVQAQGGVIINAALGTAVASGYFRNNTIGNSGIANSGSSGNDPGLDVESNGGGDLTIKVDSNQMYQWGSNGAGFLVQAGATSGNPTAVNATITNNTIAQPGTFAVASNAQGFQLNNGTTSGENFTTCLLFSGNVLNGSGTGAGGDARFRQRFDTKVQLPGYTGPQDGVTGTPTLAQFIQGLNPTGPPSVTSVSSTAGGGGFFNTSGGANCALPGF